MPGDYVIMGLPASGKTTFLAALWHLVSSEEQVCRLSLSRYEGDLVYLNKIAEDWRRFKKLDRTSQVGDTDVTIYLTDRETDVTGAAFFPDLAGEAFDVQVEERKCRPRLIEGIDRDGGLIFFVNADTKEDALSVNELNARLAGLGFDPGLPVQEDVGDPPDVLLPESEDAERPEAELPEWEPRFVPAQVRIVQLLSDLLANPFQSRPRRLAVIVSAWDMVAALGLSPEQWLATHMPLAYQFLTTNRQFFDSRIYGVSAQGVDLSNSDAVDEAADLPEHSSRIRIVGPDGEGHDLTLPLVWLMAQE